MRSTSHVSDNRRKFLRYLALSPALATPALLRASGWNVFGSAMRGGKALGTLESLGQAALITSAEQALDVMEFEAVARKTLPPAHFAYLATGVDDDATVGINHEAYSHLEIRSRRLVDVSKIDASIRLLGATWETPIFLCPVSAMKAFDPEGEVAVAKAARSKHHLQILSTVASSSVEEVTTARGEPVWQQLYPTNDWNVTRAIIKRAEAAGSPALVFTVDLHNDSNRETIARARRVDDRDCSACHEKGFVGYARTKPMFDGLDLSKVTGLHAPSLTWDFVKRLKDATKMKLLLKGIVTREDAQLAVEHGTDGIVVSNHGGRAEESLRPTIECLRSQLLQIVLQEADFDTATGDALTGFASPAGGLRRSVAHADEVNPVDRNLMVENQVADNRLGHLLRVRDRRLSVTGREALHFDDVTALALQRGQPFHRAPSLHSGSGGSART
jgi:4-hydroxymandelate oxidase